MIIFATYVGVISIVLITISTTSILAIDHGQKLKLFDLPNDMKKNPLFDEFTAQKLKQDLLRSKREVTENECSKCKCGVRPRPNKPIGRIVGGENAKENEFPWMILITKTNWFPTCGASLINVQYAVTAAHCARIKDEKTNKIIILKEKDYLVVFNEHDRYKPSNKFWLPIQRFIRHKSYTEKNYESDIALIRFTKQISFSSKLFPICLSNQIKFEGLLGTVAGWGDLILNDKNLTGILQKTLMPILQNDQCIQKYVDKDSFQAEWIRPSVLCAGNSTNTVCSGDSGGPLMVTSEGRTYLAGISSLSSCDATDYPAIFTRVSSYIDWINENVEVGTCSCTL